MTSFGKRGAAEESVTSACSSQVKSKLAPLVVLVVVALLVLISVTVIQFSVSLHQTGQKVSKSIYSQLERTMQRNDIAASDNEAALYEIEKSLREQAAAAYEAPLHARGLHVIAIENASPQEGAPSAIQTVQIDMSRVGHWAALVIVEAPTHFEINGVQPEQRAKIAVEGDLPFTLASPHKGILAGFRIKAFNASLTTNVRDLRRGNQAKYYERFCGALGRWIRHYDLKFADARVWQLAGAKQIEIWQQQVMSTNKKVRFVGNGASVCRNSGSFKRY